MRSQPAATASRVTTTPATSTPTTATCVLTTAAITLTAAAHALTSAAALRLPYSAGQQRRYAVRLDASFWQLWVV